MLASVLCRLSAANIRSAILVQPDFGSLTLCRKSSCVQTKILVAESIFCAWRPLQIKSLPFQQISQHICASYPRIISASDVCVCVHTAAVATIANITINTAMNISKSLQQWILQKCCKIIAFIPQLKYFISMNELCINMLKVVIIISASFHAV